MNFIDIKNNIKAFIKEENGDFTPQEKGIFTAVIIIISILSFLTHDSKIALVCAVCGISYTVFNGKGKIYCYFFGIIGTLCYSYLAFKNGLWGNFGLNFFYYLPLEIIGLISWKKHLINKTAIKKTKLKPSEKYFFFGLSIGVAVILAIIIFIFHFSILNFLDFLVLFLSIIAMMLAVKRCVEQWYYWIAVNILSVIIWIIAYYKGSNCLATIIMWGIYLVLGIYFLKQWQKQEKTIDKTFC